MSLDRLIEEIRHRAEAELAEEERALSQEKARLAEERDRRTGAIRQQAEQAATAEANRHFAQKVAGARMQARKLEYEAREQALTASLEGVRGLLRDYTRSPEYPKLLERMVDLATQELGKDARIFGRAEDAAVLKGIAGRSFVNQPQPILGGLLAESADGDRRLALSFDELLRLREGKVRELLA